MSDSRKKVREEAEHKENLEKVLGFDEDESYHDIVEKLREDSFQMDNRIRLMSSEWEQKIDASIIMGLQVGKRRGIRYRGSRFSIQLGAAAICMLLLLTAFVRISPTFAAFMKEIPGFSGFVELISYDQSLSSAIENEYLQLVGISVEKNGYKLTVNGVIADSQRLVLLYTAEGPGINEKNSTFLPYELKNEKGQELSAVIASSHYYRESKHNNEVVQDYLDILMSPDTPVPQQLNFRLKLGEEWLEVDVPIDHSEFVEREERININQEIEIEGQKIVIENAIITPLQVAISFKADPSNKMRLNHFIDLQLVDERGRTYITNSGMGDLDNSITRNFQSPYFQKPKKLTLSARGIHLSERDLSLTINTETGETLSAPDNNLKLIGTSSNTDTLILELLLKQNDPEGSRVMYTLFKSEGTFKDAEGIEYNLEDSGNVSMRWDSGSNEATYSYSIPNRSYAQPLTFKIEEYLGYALQDIKVKIK
ncbi:DUF4179 domain-containing protein [Paenibacillus sp. PL2-23]|uniref:DUF4179 domain-containing protein n=1 Tax=Paenibacillus sp. PL2-23 TaxID=2100729 RepID=UPI0030FCDD4E